MSTPFETEVPLIEFWFAFPSTYSYLSAMRVDACCDEAGVAVRWRPFFIAPIMAAQGLRDSPFNINPLKGAYMWRDMERRAETHGIPFVRPSAFPRPGLLATRIALLATAEGWCPDFARNVFTANFVHDIDIDDPAAIAAILDAMGRDGRGMIETAASDENKQALRLETERAGALGIFGAPNFVAGNELFWGDDRLEDALRFAARGTRAQSEL